MAETNAKVTKSLAELLVAMKGHTDAMVAAGLVKVEELKLVFADVKARAKLVQKLTDEDWTQRQIAAALDVSQMTVSRDLAETNVSESETNVSPATKTRIENEQRRKAVLAKPEAEATASGLRYGDFTVLSEEIPDNSVDLIFTDPPYDRQSVKLYDDAARVAKRILKPGASFIAYSGHRHLPDVWHGCSPYLEYWWTIAGIHGGSTMVMNRLGIRVGWKPLVWFVKGTRGDIQNILSDIITGDREKEYHEWQQAEDEARYYIEKLTFANGLVVDFFVGGGTTCNAARKLGRRWIGFEIDEEAYDRASARLAEAA